MDTQKPVWPLFFTHKGTILGNGFVAEINLRGRVLAVAESDGVWVYGVNPGAIAVSAPTLNATSTELRNALTRLFIDFADEAGSFGEFRLAVENFVQESDADSVAEWEAARTAVRAGQVQAPGDLPRDASNGRPSVSVEEKAMDALTTADNPLLQQEVVREYEYGMAA